MRENIHPKFQEVEVVCACGTKFMAGTTSDKLRVEICSNCHPFFTGKQKFVDTAGRVDRFKKKLEMSESKKTAKS